MLKHFFLGLLLLQLFGLCFSANSKYNRLVVFGDSISDNGNVFKLTNGTWPPSVYFAGRFSNGKNWADYIRTQLGVKLTDYAYGSATTDSEAIISGTGPTSSVPVPGAKQQVATYLAANNQAFSKTIFVLWIGANDYVFSNFEAAPKDVVQRIKSILTTLYKAGGRKIIVANIAGFKQLPYLDTLNNATLSEYVNQEGINHNKLLKTMVRNFAETHAGTIQLFDAASTIKRLIANKKNFGIRNVSDNCLNLTSLVPCSWSSSYVWWDLFHMTTTVHEVIANAAKKVILSNKVFV